MKNQWGGDEICNEEGIITHMENYQSILDFPFMCTGRVDVCMCARMCRRGHQMHWN